MNLISEQNDLGYVKEYDFKNDEEIMCAISINIPSSLID